MLASTRARRAVAITVAVPWLAWAVMRLFGLERGVLLEIVAFTPWAALLAPLPVVLALLLRQRTVAAAATVSAIVLVASVAPRALKDGDPAAFEPGTTLTIMSLNLDDGRADPQAVARLVDEHDVDVLSVVELKSALPALEAAGLADELPHRVVSAYSRAGGAALLARGPLLRINRPQLGSYPEAPSADLRTEDGTVAITVVHPPHPTASVYQREWRLRLRALPSAGAGDLQVLTGDFNATLDHSELRRVVDRGYRDAADAAGSGLRMTWPSGGLARWLAIDHVLADRRIAVAGFSVHRVAGTDHRAIIADLILPRN